MSFSVKLNGNNQADASSLQGTNIDMNLGNSPTGSFLYFDGVEWTYTSSSGGATGATGATGASGSAGSTGNPGNPGSTGATGPGLSTYLEVYTNSNTGAWPASMFASGSSPGTGTLLYLTGFSSTVGTGTTQTIVVYNTTITYNSVILCTAISPTGMGFMGGALLEIFVGARNPGTSVTIYVRNPDTSSSFANALAIQVLIINPTS